jgi:hypothetical protein
MRAVARWRAAVLHDHVVEDLDGAERAIDLDHGGMRAIAILAAVDLRLEAACDLHAGRVRLGRQALRIHVPGDRDVTYCDVARWAVEYAVAQRNLRRRALKQMCGDDGEAFFQHFAGAYHRAAGHGD